MRCKMYNLLWGRKGIVWVSMTWLTFSLHIPGHIVSNSSIHIILNQNIFCFKIFNQNAITCSYSEIMFLFANAAGYSRFVFLFHDVLDVKLLTNGSSHWLLDIKRRTENNHGGLVYIWAITFLTNESQSVGCLFG